MSDDHSLLQHPISCGDISTPGVSPRPTVAVSATFTAEGLRDILRFWTRELNWNSEIRFAAYNQVFQQLLDPAGLLAQNRNGYNVVLVRFEDWLRYRNSPSPQFPALEAEVQHFLSCVETAAATFASPIIVGVCPASPKFRELPGCDEFLHRMGQMVASRLAHLGVVHIVTAEAIDELYPVPEIHDPHGDELGHLPYTPAYFAALGTMLVRRIHTLRRPSYKVIALDCDDTLWNGICGEDGPAEVTVDEPSRRLQEFMRRQKDAGMLLCLCSKNNEEDVLETFQCHPDMPLRLEDFVARKISWEPKADSLAALAEELDLGLESFILVDDNPKECSETQIHCPEVLALALPEDRGEIPNFLNHVWAFDRARVTDEDRKRTAMYAQQVERKRLERSSQSLEQFLAALHLSVKIAPVVPEQMPRIAQLTQRTNQMNFTAVRRTEAEIAGWLHTANECLAVIVSDRFGNYGLTGALLFETRPDVLAVDSFLLSCRALGRGVEHRMLSRLGEIARERGLEVVEVPFRHAPRNRPAYLFLESVGSRFRSEVDGGLLYRFPAEYAAGISYHPGNVAQPLRKVEPPQPANESEEETIDYARIASQFSDPLRLVEESRSRPCLERKRGIPVEPPRNELERNLVDLWVELLGCPVIGVHDNFFELGGHSLLVVQLLSRVRQQYGLDLTLDVVYGGDFTVAALARAIEVQEIEEAGADQYSDLLRELEGLSDEEVRTLLAETDDAPRDRSV